MTDHMPPVTGPFRIYVGALPTGASLDVSHYLTTVMLGLATAAEEDGESLLDELRDIAELDRSAGAQGLDSYAAHERDERVAGLLAEIAGGGTVPVYGAQVLRLAEALRATVAPKSVPAQRSEGGVAA
ncbi:hypothetical protein [Streptomyces sp. NPDC058045]|uniref:hypothetical protein n=1 Tax=Streptomyces sp. NPDC058045 TaxID=3346311 RepID=UPI0036E613CD